ncbi:hypothetical protein JI666_20810 [Bacillus sp. NTK071]|uniref:hypothetical protein n=1 Tax=Bacillus sp. NTK071 TaxID=2802175 RepID=UPI001A8D0517|nr:hypothetical protein [Bacillus sp. NTK071]MBN8211164.1 hypothetical protein [Bacillus sp. NTK071]
MTKQEFLQRYNSENLTIGAEYMMVLDGVTDEPLVLGCAYDQGVWKVYKTRERGGHYIIKEFTSENEAFDFFYELVLSQHNFQINNY